MKPRKWVFVVACCVFLLVSVYYWSISFLEKNGNIERLLIQTISSSTGSAFTVGKVKFGFLSVYLENVSMALGADFFRIDIHDLKVGFSLKNLIRFRGNISRSISKMILIRPDVVVFFKDSPAASPVGSFPASKTIDIFSMLRNLPIDQFFVRDGTVRLVDKRHKGFSISEELSGSIKAQPSGVSFDLQGALAARRKNLSVSGFLSKDSRQTRISMRLNKARIQKPIRWDAFELRAGILDGVCEISLPYPLSSATMESVGWVRLRGATATVDGVDEPLSDLMLSMTLLNASCRIDSVKGSWNGISIKGSGLWNVAGDFDSASAIVVQCQGIRPEFLLRKKTKNVAAALRGNGWLLARMSKKRSTVDKSLTLAAGGITLWGAPVLASAKVTVENKQLTIDSCTIQAASMGAFVTGIVNYAKSPIAYGCNYSFKADSLPFIPALRGSGAMRVRGSLHGLGAKPRFEATIDAARLRCMGVALGYPEINVTGEGPDHILFDFAQGNGAYIHATGSIDGCSSKIPYVRAQVSIGPEALRSAMSRAIPSIVVDSSRISGMFSGSVEEFELSGSVIVHASAIHGKAPFRIAKSKKSKTILFNVTHSELYAGDSALPFAAAGDFRESIFHVDSLSLMGAVRGSGYFNTGAQAGGAMEFFLKYHNLSIPAINTWIFRRRLPIKNGWVAGNSRIYGSHGRISSESEFSMHGCSINNIDELEAVVSVRSRDTTVTVLPTVIKKDGEPFISLDTMRKEDGGFRCAGRFDNVALKTMLAGALPDEFISGENEIKGAVSGAFYSEKSGLPIHVRAGCPSITMNSWHCDSLQADIDIVNQGIVVKRLSLSDSSRVHIACSGSIPWSTMTGTHGDCAAIADTMDVRITASGDLLASFEQNISKPFNVPVAGSGRGSVDIELRGIGGPPRLYKMQGGIPKGILKVKPYVTQDIKDFSCVISMDQANVTNSDSGSEPAPKVTIDLNGTINKRPIRIVTSHVIPRGLEALRLGFLDAGVVEVVTQHHGVNLHLPGMMEAGAIADIEFAPKAPFPAFLLSGPVDKIRISGTWILHGGEFTFPPMKNSEIVYTIDPFPYITWDFDLKAVNRKLKYFYDTGTKNRRLMRLVECYLDPISTMSLRGRDLDHSFKVLGALRSYKGSVFFRRVFDQNFEVGLDFEPRPLGGGNGFDNMPIIWGSAEGISEKNRLDRIKLTLITRDSVTGALSEKGRFYDIRFRVSSDGEEMPGESEVAFLKTEGKRVASVEGAGELVSTLGEQYVHRFLLQNIQDRLARSLGLDVITFETSIASNYFNKLYNRQLINLANDWSYLAFANVGITLGRYILYDKVFLKWRTELVPVDTLIKPEYTMGFEFQPLNYFMMDFDYGVRPGEKSLEQNPKIYMQLRLPIETIRNYFKF